MPSPYARPAAVFGAVLALVSLAAPMGASAAPVTLAAALERAQAQSPLITSAQAALAAAQGRARQAGFSPNPEASLESENIAGSGPYEGFSNAETTFSIGQRLELGGKRRTRAAAAQAEVEALTKLHSGFPGKPLIVLAGPDVAARAGEAVGLGAQHVTPKDDLTSAKLSSLIRFYAAMARSSDASVATA